MVERNEMSICACPADVPVTTSISDDSDDPSPSVPDFGVMVIPPVVVEVHVAPGEPEVTFLSPSSMGVVCFPVPTVVAPPGNEKPTPGSRPVP